MLPGRVAWLIGLGCVVTVLLALLGMQSLWELADGIVTGRVAFVYESALALGVAAAIACAWLPRFPVARLVRVAVLLPIIHLIAIFVAAALWSLLEADMRHALREWDVGNHMRGLALPAWQPILAAAGAIAVLAIVIQRRHGEWAHAAVMMTLSFLLLVGLWLPFLSNMSVELLERAYTPYYDAPPPALRAFGFTVMFGSEYSRRLLDPTSFALCALVPPALLSLGFTTLAFRAPRSFARCRRLVGIAVKVALPVTILFALALPAGGWRLYLESSPLVLSALLLAIGALLTLTATTWLRSRRMHRSLRGQGAQAARVADDEQSGIARFEITSWLRGPRLAVRPFVLDTPHGDVPVHGAALLAPVPPASTQLEVGQHVDVLAAGDRVLAAGRARATDGPFRALAATDIVLIAAHDARPWRFSDVALVVWRPAVAYLAILVAVALPYLSIVLT